MHGFINVGFLLGLKKSKILNFKFKALKRLKNGQMFIRGRFQKRWPQKEQVLSRNLQSATQESLLCNKTSRTLPSERWFGVL